MSWGSALRKVRGGKTVKVEVRVEEGVIREVVISGDFFAYPPEAIEELERALVGASVEEAASVVRSFKGRVQVVGASLKDFEELLVEAARHAEESAPKGEGP